MMRKIIFFLLGFLLVVPLFGVIAAQAPVQKATLFNIMTGERKIVIVGQAGIWGDGWELETPTNNYNIYPQIYRMIDKITGEEKDEICYGYECDKYKDNEIALGAIPVTRYKTNLTSSMTTSQTTVPVNSIKTFDGVTLTMNLLGNDVYLSLEAGAAKEEIVHCDDMSGNSFTSCDRGLAFYATSTASVAANRKTHNAGSAVVISNVHYVYVSTVNANTWEQNQTFSKNIVVVGDITVGDDIYLYDLISGLTDTNTYLQFNQADELYLFAGGVEMISLVEGTSDYVAINMDSADVDFVVKSDNASYYNIYTDGANVKTGIGTDSTPAATLEIGGATATTTLMLTGTTKGGCLKIQDIDNGGYTYCYTLNGTMTCSTDSCE